MPHHHSPRTVTELPMATRPVIEHLERRTLLSAALIDGEVFVEGTEGDDVVVIARHSADPSNRYTVDVNGTVSEFNIAEVDRFRIFTFGGDDLVIVDSTFGVIPVSRFVDLGGGDDTFLGSAGRDVVRGVSGNNLIVGGAGNDELYGGTGNDTLSGGSGDDLIDGGGGSNRLVGGLGNDTIFGGEGNDFITGGDGEDLIHGTSGINTILGGRGNDRIFGGSDSDLLDGGGGHDYIAGGGGNNVLFGREGDDTLIGNGEDLLWFAGEEAPPVLVGNNILDGGPGNDWLVSHTGSDTLIGGPGGDVFDARMPDDHVLVDREPNETVPAEAVFSETDIVQSDLSINLTIHIRDEGEMKQVFIPTGTGSFPGGISVALAEDDEGTIRFRDVIGRDFKLAEFFQAWGITFASTHISRFFASPANPLTMTVNGVPNSEFQDYTVQDGDEIVIRYGPID